MEGVQSSKATPLVKIVGIGAVTAPRATSVRSQCAVVPDWKDPGFPM